MADGIELHGLLHCPYAWRVRLAATLKGVPFEWLPCDAEPADPRCERHDPFGRSPLLFEDGFTLTESTVIAVYLDESRDGVPLQAPDPRTRALGRLAIAELEGLTLHVPMPRVPVPLRRKAEEALDNLERRLADGRAHLDGIAPGLVDAHVWPALATLAANGLVIPDSSVATRAYWQRARVHPGYATTPKPPWAVEAGL